MSKRSLNVNGKSVYVDVPDDMPLLWVLRDELGLTGAKYGCGIGVCGACSVHLDGEVVRSCQVPIDSIRKKQRITTIEGLARNGVNHPAQNLWIENSVPQCGYCQTGMIMAAAELLARVPNPTDDDIDAAMTNICRCGTYPRILAALRTAKKAGQAKT